MAFLTFALEISQWDVVFNWGRLITKSIDAIGSEAAKNTANAVNYGGLTSLFAFGAKLFYDHILNKRKLDEIIKKIEYPNLLE